MKKYAIIVAAGEGRRMGSKLPKQFLELDGIPLFCHSLRAFAAAFSDTRLILVMHPDHLEAAGAAIARHCSFAVNVIPGGATRSASVMQGLALVDEEAIVFVHDGVRCLLTTDLIHTCYRVALEKGNAVPAVPAADSVRLVTETGNKGINRQAVRLIQTPQTFHAGLLKRAYEGTHGEDFTDDATVVEQAGTPIELVEGEPANIKITRPADLAIAAAILSGRAASGSDSEAAKGQPPGRS